ncbi:MAG: hypothetical protein ACI9D5_000093 [Candidatus Endobugula sp.]|jgi:hypothetical protein
MSSNKAEKYFRLSVIVFIINTLLAVVTITVNYFVSTEVARYIAYFWGLTTITYGALSGAYFYQFGRFKWLWGIVIIVTQPIGILVSFPIILRKGYKNGWHKNP